MTGIYINLGIAVVVAFLIFMACYPSIRKMRLPLVKFFLLVVILGPGIVSISYCLIPFYYLEPYEGRVVDEVTGEPIPEAVVLVIYRSEGWSPAGDIGGDVDIRETLTDVNGEFRLPPYWEIRPFKSGSPYGRVFAWKPGYSIDIIHWPNYPNTYWYIGKKHRFNPPPYAIYKLHKLNTREERMKTLHFLSLDPMDFPTEKRKEYTNYWYEERANLGF